MSHGYGVSFQWLAMLNAHFSHSPEVQLHIGKGIQHLEIAKCSYYANLMTLTVE